MPATTLLSPSFSPTDRSVGHNACYTVLPKGAGGIRHDSVLFCEEITTIDREFLIDGPLGDLVPDDVLDEVLRAVRRALGEAVPEVS